MEKEFVTYEQALALKELGFDEECLGGYTKTFPYDNECKFYIDDIDCEIQAPLKQQVFRWFREKYQLISVIVPTKEDKFEWAICSDETLDYIRPRQNKYTYEEAENACIDKLIELTKTK